MSFVAFFFLFCMSIGTTHFVVILFERVRLGGQMSTANKLVSLDFEVFGIVQGVFFRKNTVGRGKQLGLRGWCMNTDRGTVLGHLEGESERVEEMKRWLKYTGSPMSKIEKAEFRNEKNIDDYTLNEFKVRH